MSGPMILKEDLGQDKLADMQSFITKFMSQSVPDDLLAQQCPQLPFLPDQSTAVNIDGEKFKICVIEKEEIKLSDNQGEKPLNFEILTSSNDHAPQVPICGTSKDSNETSMGDASNSHEVESVQNENSDSESMNGANEYNGTESSTEDFDQSKVTNGQTDAATGPTNGATVERVDDEVMGNLLDYNRKFNERQLGLEVSEDVPCYTKTDEPPTSVVCDNNIIKEAIMRVKEKQEAGFIMKEPTIIRTEEDDKKVFDEYAAHSKIAVIEKNDNINYNNNSVNWSPDPKSTHDDEELEWNKYGANFIEKALQRRIDEGKKGIQENNRNSKKWDKKDIVKLVEMLSKKRESVKRPSREWSCRIPVVNRQDDLLLQIEDFENQETKEDNLFDRLKEGPANDDGLELKQLVNENCNPNHSDKIVHSMHNVYSGGDELDVFIDCFKNTLNLSWLFTAYDKVVRGLFDNYREGYGANGGIASGYDADSTWFKWKLRLNRVKSISGWLSGGWIFGGKTGKPIYKQVEYEKTKVISWQEKYASEVGGCKNKLKKRKLRNIHEETIVDLEGGLETQSTKLFGDKGHLVRARTNDTVLNLEG